MDHSQAREAKVPSRDQRPSLTSIYFKKKKGKEKGMLRLSMELAYEIKNGTQFTHGKLAHVLFLKEAHSHVWKLNVVGVRVHLKIARKSK